MASEKIGNDIVYSIASLLLRVVTRMGWVIFASKLLPLDSFADYSNFIAYGQLMPVVLLLGLPQLLMRGIALKSLFTSGRVLFFSISLPVIVCVSVYQDYPYYFFSMVCAVAVNSFFSAALKGSGFYKQIFYGELCACGILLGGYLALSTSSISAPALSVVHRVIGWEILSYIPAIVIGASCLLDSKRNCVPSSCVTGEFWRVGIANVIDYALWKRCEIYFLSGSAVGTAVFSIAMLIGNGFALLPAAVGDVLFTRMSKESDVRSRDLFLIYRNKFYGGVFILAILSLIACIFYCLYFNKKYYDYVYLIAILATSRVLMCASGVDSIYLYSRGQGYKLMWAVAWTAGVAFVANGLFTARYGVNIAIVIFIVTRMSLSIVTILKSSCFRRNFI